MKHILITGANSYIGTSFEKYLSQWPQEYRVDTLDMVDGSWREKSFAGYDCVFHVAGIAHQDSGTITEERKQQYYRINTDLTVDTAAKAKQDGVKQFVFMSSIIVYGVSGLVGQERMIGKDTKETPEGAYGDSKLKAEHGILQLHSDSFKVCVLRPPMIYGPRCKGNYPLLSKLARKTPVFPNIPNQRSMLYVGNLCAFVKHAIDKQLSGILFPQNGEYVSTSRLVQAIGQVHGKKIRLTKVFNPFIKLLARAVPTVNKVFGNLVVDMGMSNTPGYHVPVSFAQSIRESEEK